MAKSTQLIQQFARAGALARLSELKAELAEIERTFPGLEDQSSGGRRPRRPRAAEPQADAAAPAPNRRTRKPMSAAQKKAVGERMKKYWAARRKAQAK